MKSKSQKLNCFQETKCSEWIFFQERKMIFILEYDAIGFSRLLVFANERIEIGDPSIQIASMRLKVLSGTMIYVIQQVVSAKSEYEKRGTSECFNKALAFSAYEKSDVMIKIQDIIVDLLFINCNCRLRPSIKAIVFGK